MWYKIGLVIHACVMRNRSEERVASNKHERKSRYGTDKLALAST